MGVAEPRLRTVAVVLAGGVGRRVGEGTPKQLLKIAGRAVIEHTLAVFQEAAEVDEILVLMAAGYTGEVERIVERGGFGKVSRVVEGGATRTESTWRALEALGAEECDVLLHDAVRPLVEPSTITACVQALRTHVAVEVAIPSSDTLLVVDTGPEGETVRDIPDRTLLRRAQTPQCFRLSVIREAYERAFADPDFAERQATDDCGVVLRYLPGVPIHIVPGSEHNMKVTHPVDLHIADRLLRLAPATRHADAEARHRALAGKTVVAFGDGPELSHLAELAGEYGAAVHWFSRSRDEVRVEDAGAVAEALGRVAKERGRIDVVVGVGGPERPLTLADADDDALREVIAVHHLGPLTVARAALPHLRDSGGHLLLRASSPTPGAGRTGVYASAGAAVAALAEALNDEWAGYGVHVACLDAADTTLASPDALAQAVLDAGAPPPPRGPPRGGARARPAGRRPGRGAGHAGRRGQPRGHRV
ncbi:bifunctional cytidylyltransferase/SDR family oxidoreductase, partial [Sphaerisporangium sp. TRM90804]|uniref:bifunctional cytidylyltransferase/SDR family oxidoreductase n=1 Tax=Sphaerisporangium sp. TRM90804 TaxID=3031113 RepID=UPI002448208F